MKTLRSTSLLYPHLDAEQLAAALAGRLRVYWHNQQIVSPLHDVEQDAFQRALAKGYVVARWTQDRLFNAYYHWCEVKGRPYIRVTPRQRYADVTMDLIATPDLRLDDNQRDAIRRLLHEAALQAPTWRGYLTIRWGPVLYWCNRIPIHLAEPTAAAIYAIATMKTLKASAIWPDAEEQGEQAPLAEVLR